TRQRRVPMLLYLPKGAAGARPLVLMSHGAGGSRRANHAQSRHLASHGFAVLALEHVGSDTARLLRGGNWMANLREMISDRDELLARPRDVRFALDMAQQWTEGGTALRGRLDLTRAALVGHSYGAYTALVGCGARGALDWMVPPSGRGLAADESDPRLKACVAYSPQGPGEPFFLDSSYASIRRPVLHVSGSRDQLLGGRPPLQRQQAFDRSPPGGHVLLWLAHADHSAFSDPTGSGQNGLPSAARADAQPVTRAATLAFLQRELLDRADADAHLTQGSLQALRRGIVDDIEVRRR
ncbi:MAG: alpha/beta hydrolase family protein, partial [Aquabacterium sp.]